MAVAQNEQDISGRISVVTGVPPDQHNLYGGFRLTFSPGGDGQLEVFSPLGAMLAQARWSAHTASLNDGRQIRYFHSFEDMTAAALGLALPREALENWVQGRPAAALPFDMLGDGAFEQLGWRVEPRLRDGRIHLLHAKRLGGDPAQLSLVIDQVQSGGGLAASAARSEVPVAPAP